MSDIIERCEQNVLTLFWTEDAQVGRSQKKSDRPVWQSFTSGIGPWFLHRLQQLLPSIFVACTLKDVIHILNSLITFTNFRICQSHVILMCRQGGVIQQEPCVTDGNASVLWKDDLRPTEGIISCVVLAHTDLSQHCCQVVVTCLDVRLLHVVNVITLYDMDGIMCRVDLAILSSSSFQAMPEWLGIHAITVTTLRSLRVSAANLWHC